MVVGFCFVVGFSFLFTKTSVVFQVIADDEDDDGFSFVVGVPFLLMVCFKIARRVPSFVAKLFFSVSAIVFVEDASE